MSPCSLERRIEVVLPNRVLEVRIRPQEIVSCLARSASRKIQDSVNSSPSGYGTTEQLLMGLGQEFSLSIIRQIEEDKISKMRLVIISIR